MKEEDYKEISREDGHIWIKHIKIKPIACKICGVVKRGDGKKNKRCRGSVKIGLRTIRSSSSKETS